MTDLTKRRIIKWLWILAAFPFAALFLLLLIVWIFADIPSLEELEHPVSKQATQVIAEGGEILTTFHLENRTYIDYSEISPYLVQAAVSTEDLRFYDHSGIDFKGLGRVFFKTLLSNDSSQGGGSTISQQLAKTLYPREDMSSSVKVVSKAKMVWTKMKEWITAVRIERNYTKDEIMAMYLNSIFFGSGAYGVETASTTFFKKKPAELNIQESALLIGMVNKPTRYNPVLNPEPAKNRRDFVIGQMAKAGFIDGDKVDSLRNCPIVLNFKFLDHNAGLAPYFRDMLRRDMNAEKPRRSRYRYVEDYTADSLRWENDPLYGWLNKYRKSNGERYNLDNDGLRIYTTINSKMQQYAEEAVAEHLSEIQKSFFNDLKYRRNPPFSDYVKENIRESIMRQAIVESERYAMGREAGMSEKEILRTFDVKVKMRVFAWNKNGYEDVEMTPLDSIKYYKSILRAGLMAIEPGTGNVRAYVGGPAYRTFKYDNVSQGKRQIGSTVKPFIYSLALTEGMTPCDRVINARQVFELSGGNTWSPREANCGGELTLKMGLTLSNNNISAFLMKQFGPAAVVSQMHRMGIPGHIDEVYSLCVGSSDVSVKEMVAAYNVFPSKGVYYSPVFVTKIEDSKGTVLTRFSSESRDVLNEGVCAWIVDMMENVINSGTGGRLRYQFGLTGKMAGKTGTTNDNSDGWFIGYTPTICAGVWVGAENREVHFRSTALGQGASMALPIWGRFIKKCMADPSVNVNSTDEFPFYSSPSCGEGEGRLLGGGSEDGGDSPEEAEVQNEDYYFN